MRLSFASMCGSTYFKGTPHGTAYHRTVAGSLPAPWPTKAKVPKPTPDAESSYSLSP